MVALRPGHTIGVVVTKAATPRVAALDRLLGDEPGEDYTALAKHTKDLVQGFVDLGIAEADISVVWDFPVAADAGAPLRSAISQLAIEGPATFDFIRDVADDVVPPMTWRAAEGHFPVTDFLVDDARLDLAADGTVSPTGTAESDLYVHIPTSASTAEPGTVPVLLFGHGIFSQANNYLDQEDDPSGVLALAEEGGFIVIATRWRGLTSTDLVEVIEAANDFSQFDSVAERLVQGQVNNRSLIEMVRDGTLFTDPVFQNAAGEVLPDPNRLSYYGISLGGIEGAVLLAQDAPLDAAVLHVGGGFWSTMLERSSNWPTFENLMEDQIPDPADRQLMYAVSQLWWDAVDPITYADKLSDVPMLFQYSLGDEQVPNMTTEALARSINLPILTPNGHVPWGLETIDGPLPPGSRALVQFDPEVPHPPQTNRPLQEGTGAHVGPRVWAGTRAQTIAHSELGSEGQIIHFCGVDVCSASNTGE
jgi:pimeloyl-ACP methyl ester carboxylesterase